jgi:hypothetical protein
MDRIGGGREVVCVWDEDGLRVELDHGCFAEMTWRMSFAQPLDVNALVDSLLSAGFRDATRFPRVREIEEPAGHRLVLVPTTGRIQLRLHYLTAQGRRREEAIRIARLLTAARAQL